MARRRRTREEARAEILQVAQRWLEDRGPDAIRIDDIAADIGVSRQAVLHHFGTREELLREVVRLAWLGLFEDLASLTAPLEGTGGSAAAALVERLDDVTRRKGNARLGAWLLLSGQGLPEALFEGALAALPSRLAGDGPPEAQREASYALLLVGAALFGDAIFGVRLRQALSLPDGEEARADFRRWLVERLPAGLGGPGPREPAR